MPPRPCAAARIAGALACMLAAAAAPAAVTIERDDEGRIVRVVTVVHKRKEPGTYTIEAAPGADVRGGAARLHWELAVTGGSVRAEGTPVAVAAPTARDENGVAIEVALGAPGPSADAFESLTVPQYSETLWALICASSVGFGEPEVGDSCRAMWLYALRGARVPLDPALGPPYEPVPAERSALDEALLGCGSAYGTSCEEDGLDLRFADAGTLHRSFEEAVTDDSEVRRRIAWNWLVARLLRGGVEPGIGAAADCTYATPEECTALAASYVRFPAHRVLPDEPIAGPPLRWDWETGTTFDFGPLSVDGSVSPVLVQTIQATLDRVHVAGPFVGADGEPDVATYWIPEPAGGLMPLVATAALLAIRRRRGR